MLVLPFIIFVLLAPLIGTLGVPEFIQGESCDPTLDRLYPFENQTAFFLYCDNSQNRNILQIRSCPTGQHFDKNQGKCAEMVKGKENKKEEEEIWVEMETEGTSPPTLATQRRPPMASPSMGSPVVPPPLVVFKEKEAGKGQKNESRERQKEFILNDSMGMGSELVMGKTPTKAAKMSGGEGREKGEDESAKTAAVRYASLDGGPKVVVANRRRGMWPIEPKGQVGSTNEEEERGKGGEGEEEKANRRDPDDHHRDDAAAKNGHWQQEKARMVDASANIVVNCKDNSMPLIDNNGAIHRCLPQYGHNPFSPLSCPLHYECRQFQCCPRIDEPPPKMAIDQPAGRLFDDFGEEEEGLTRICPVDYSPKLHPSLGLPTICSADWPLSSCPPFSRCHYSPPLGQFICCQPLGNGLIKELAQISQMANGRIWHKKGPQIGIMPAQPGCISHVQCQVHTPNTRCIAWICKCQGKLVAFNGKCLFQCPPGFFALHGLCTSSIRDGGDHPSLEQHHEEEEEEEGIQQRAFLVLQ